MKKSGFTLVELSIVLVIIGIVAAFTMETFNIIDKIERARSTKEKMEKISNAILNYVFQNDGLPDVACPSLGERDANFGKSVMTSGIAISCDADSVTAGVQGDIIIKSISGTTLRYGTVPIKTLGLDNSYMFDGFGNRITFVIDRKFLAPRHLNSGEDAFFDSDDSEMILDVNGVKVAFVMISHGTNGLGAWNKDYARAVNIGRNQDPVNAEELSNAPTASSDQSFAITSSSNVFDDIVKYEIKSNLIIKAGVKFAKCASHTDLSLNWPTGEIGKCYEDTGNNVTDNKSKTCGSYGIWKTNQYDCN